MALGALWRERSWALCSAVGGAPAHVPAGCPPGERGSVPPGGAGRHRTGLFHLKSAGFKAGSVLTVTAFRHSCPSAEFIKDAKLQRVGKLVSHVGQPAFSRVKCIFIKKEDKLVFMFRII